ncbi:MAG: hypothetical protein H0X33_14220 [Taibaiella sp.]|nr:hypothetical protein [Taibaiella sp.]
MLQCESFYDFIVQCSTEIQVNALLAPATQYKWIISGRFGEYSGYATTDGNGFFSIPIIDLPDGLLTSYSGTFTLRVMNAVDECRQVQFKAAKYYDEICFEVKNGTREKANLGCSFECVAPSGGNGNSAVFPVNNLSTLHLVWTSLLNSFYGSAPEFSVYNEISPNVYQLVGVSIIQNRSGYSLDSIDFNFGGPLTGYILIG